ncbi:glutathione S-transferase family protein [Roseibium alexandrii]|uniref:Glutathione S-transferase n=1 Tax=Roseibium alexandrii (strain DSM 17067 / NCIMB 14079 / DFL-11) TaxID=244592 RepID=A0A5E8GZR7_ROSAD|nr:glutathione S-transferase family protein [Roseibium alexandrii]EEE45121.1 Glutathione S-transferase [Roseibium alexandrii DFL-11]
MLKVWGRKTSSNVQALMWCIGELGLEYERSDIGHSFGGTDTEAFRRLNPNQTIPVLQDANGQTIWETGAILRYLADRYGPESFWPEQPQDRAQVDMWAEWSKITIAMAFTAPVFWRVVRTPREAQDWNQIRRAVAALESKLEIAEQRLTNNPFLAGPDFTLADIQFGHILYRYYDIDIDRADLPRLKRYYHRLTERIAFREHVMVSYEDLRES